MIDFVKETFATMTISALSTEYSEHVNNLSIPNFLNSQENLDFNKLKYIYKTILKAEEQFIKLKNLNCFSTERLNPVKRKIDILKLLVERKGLN